MSLVPPPLLPCYSKWCSLVGTNNRGGLDSCFAYCLFPMTHCSLSLRLSHLYLNIDMNSRLKPISFKLFDISKRNELSLNGRRSRKFQSLLLWISYCPTHINLFHHTRCLWESDGPSWEREVDEAEAMRECVCGPTSDVEILGWNSRVHHVCVCLCELVRGFPVWRAIAFLPGSLVNEAKSSFLGPLVSLVSPPSLSFVTRSSHAQVTENSLVHGIASKSSYLFHSRFLESFHDDFRFTPIVLFSFISFVNW